MQAAQQERPELYPIYKVNPNPLLFNKPIVVESGFLKSISVSVLDLLKVDLIEMSDKKKAIYEKLISSLSDQDKVVLMTFARCQPRTIIPDTNISQIPLKIEMKEDTYSYCKEEDSFKDWHVNFADEYLFGFYSQDLFGQDEIQCAEHPLLGHIKELAMYYIEQGCAPLTSEKEHETPILITNVKRIGKIDISANQSKNQKSLYGNNFYFADIEDIKSRTSHIQIEEQTFTNLISMAALQCKKGQYTQEDIQYTFRTALKSFISAVQLSEQKKVVIHTGNWGCGVFGNNFQLISLIQLSAAKVAGVSIIVYHTFNSEGSNGFNKGKELYHQFMSQINSLNQQMSTNQFEEQLIKYCRDQKFNWREGDGN